MSAGRSCQNSCVVVLTQGDITALAFLCCSIEVVWLFCIQTAVLYLRLHVFPALQQLCCCSYMVRFSSIQTVVYFRLHDFIALEQLSCYLDMHSNRYVVFEVAWPCFTETAVLLFKCDITYLDWNDFSSFFMLLWTVVSFPWQDLSPLTHMNQNNHLLFWQGVSFLQWITDSVTFLYKHSLVVLWFWMTFLYLNCCVNVLTCLDPTAVVQVYCCFEVPWPHKTTTAMAWYYLFALKHLCCFGMTWPICTL